jgi:GT2 family glycosyltransferase
MPPLRIHIAILAHNALEYTDCCVASLIEHTTTAHQVHILDNGSTDGTREWLETLEEANINMILSSQNLGVGAGRNRLLAAILERAQPEELILFLDNDVEVAQGWDQPFAKLFAQKPDAAIAGVTGHDILIEGDRRELLPSPLAGPTEVDVVSGYCLGVRAAIATRLGPFDENLGLFWHEDDDYCIRAIGLGHRVYALPETPLIHHEHRSGAAHDSDADERSLLNQRYLVAKWRRLGLAGADGRIVRKDCEPTSPCREVVQSPAEVERKDADRLTRAFWATSVILTSESDSA